MREIRGWILGLRIRQSNTREKERIAWKMLQPRALIGLRLGDGASHRETYQGKDHGMDRTAAAVYLIPTSI
jgi:hypothetical protein